LLLVLPLVVASGREEPPFPGPPAPVVKIAEPVSGWTTRRIVPVRGTVSGEGPPERVTLVVNGVAQKVPLLGGAYESEQVLAPGRNTVVVLAEGEGGVGRASVSIHARVPRKDLRVTLTWDRPASDVDLRLVGPDGERCDYENREAGFGATLDTDVTEGYGPETITVGRAPAGTYRVEVHYYGDHGGGPTLCRVVTIRDEGTARERRERASVLLRETDDVREVTTFRVEGP
jgi:uncharacterized protein YfaP (DUF2135 family)